METAVRYSTNEVLYLRIERVEGLVFEGEGQVFHLIERIVAPLGLRVDESMPYVDARSRTASGPSTTTAPNCTG